MNNLWRQSPSGRVTSENLVTNLIAQEFWENSGILLVVQDLSSSPIIDAVSLVQIHNIAVQDLSSTSISENAILTQIHNLTTQDCISSPITVNLILQ